jgi:selT/selW/selH-like putative selenoprotein
MIVILKELEISSYGDRSIKKVMFVPSTVVRIEFCGVCVGFKKEAEMLKDMVEKKGINVEMIEAGKGRFSVYINGDLTFSIKKNRRYPRAKEIFELIMMKKNKHKECL